MTNERKKIVAVLSDLLFTVKIQEAAKKAGTDMIFVKSHVEALAQAQQHPAAIILDLNDAGAEPLELIERLKADEQTRNISLLGYVSHVQGDLIKAARERGCDTVMPRSAFSLNLADILRGYAID